MSTLLVYCTSGLFEYGVPFKIGIELECIHNSKTQASERRRRSIGKVKEARELNMIFNWQKILPTTTISQHEIRWFYTSCLFSNFIFYFNATMTCPSKEGHSVERRCIYTPFLLFETKFNIIFTTMCKKNRRIYAKNQIKNSIDSHILQYLLVWFSDLENSKYAQSSQFSYQTDTRHIRRRKTKFRGNSLIWSVFGNIESAININKSK